MKINTLIVLLALGMILIAGCIPTMTTEEEETINIEDLTVTQNTTQTETQNLETETPVTNEDITITEDGIIIEAVEGELIELRPEAIDPDGDEVKYYFTEPFNENGKWQSKEGDMGKYLITITASDGKENTTQDVLLILHKANKAPIIECPKGGFAVKEGEVIDLSCNIYDIEGDSIVVEYDGFMKESTYTTTYDDAGEYTVQIKAKDKEKESTESIQIKIVNVNRAPGISNVEDKITVMETEIVTLNPVVEDPDGDKVSVTFSEPFDEKGVWKTTIGDAGVHKASIVANDGEATTKKEVVISVTQKNTAPVLSNINTITVYEGETIELPIEATDREGDKLSVKVEGWMNTQTYTTTYDDAGEYVVTVIVSDGEYQTKQNVKVVVVDRNRAPIFKVPA